MKKLKNDESGIIVVAVVFLIAVLVFGYVAFRSISRSRQADEVQDSASEVIDKAKDLVQ